MVQSVNVVFLLRCYCCSNSNVTCCFLTTIDLEYTPPSRTQVVAKAVSAMKARVKADSPRHAQLCLDGWSAMQVGYLGANLGRCWAALINTEI